MGMSALSKWQNQIPRWHVACLQSEKSCPYLLVNSDFALLSKSSDEVSLVLLLFSAPPHVLRNCLWPKLSVPSAAL